MKIGVLALQGAFREHAHMIERCSADPVEIRLPAQLTTMDGLIIPGGESTTIAKLLVEYEFLPAIKTFASHGKPIFGTCAGAILLADRKEGQRQDFLDLIDMDITRNAYGRQIDSREAPITLAFSPSDPFNAVFIRAPIIQTIGPRVRALSFYHDTVVLARENTILVSTFHPELTADTTIHRYFLDMVRQSQSHSQSEK